MPSNVINCIAVAIRQAAKIENISFELNEKLLHQVPCRLRHCLRVLLDGVLFLRFLVCRLFH